MYRHIRTGQLITSVNYRNLSYSEQRNYQPDGTSSNRDIVDTIVDVGVGMAIESVLGSIFDDDSSSSSNYDSSSSNDSSRFDDGFGGGDYSGGGSSGEW